MYWNKKSCKWIYLEILNLIDRAIGVQFQTYLISYDKRVVLQYIGLFFIDILFISIIIFWRLNNKQLKVVEDLVRTLKVAIAAFFV